MTLLTVGPGQDFDTISAAIAAARDGDVVEVQAGTYVNDFADINVDVTLRAVGGTAELVATVAPPNGKAIFNTTADVTIDGFAFSGTAVPDQNGAGIRHQGGALTVLNSRFEDNENGILSGYDPAATLTIRSSEFVANGNGTGYTHNLYVGDIARLVVEDSVFRDADAGHQIKSRAQETVITGSVLEDNDSRASYSVDLPNGGRALLQGNIIQQGPNSENFAMVSFGVEGGVYADSSLELRGNTVVNELPGGVLVWNYANLPVTISDTEVYGLAAEQMISGPGTVTGTTFIAAPPAAVAPAPGDDEVGDPVAPPVDEVAEDPVAPPVDDVAEDPVAPPVDEVAEDPVAPPVDEVAEEPAAPPVDDAEEATEGAPAAPAPVLVVGESFSYGPGVGPALFHAVTTPGGAHPGLDFAALGMGEAAFGRLVAATQPWADLLLPFGDAGEAALRALTNADAGRCDGLLG